MKLPLQTRQRLGLGTASLSHLYHSVSETQALQTIDKALEYGIRYFDTAPRYGQGQSEQRLGLALKGVPRSDYWLSSKVGWAGTATITKHDFSREAIVSGISQSFERLGVDYLDIVYLHDPDEHFEQALNEALPTLLELQASGMVKQIGVGMNQWQMLARFAQNNKFECFLMAGRYTLLDQSGLYFLDQCHTKHTKVFLGGVFNSGVLATGSQNAAKFNYQNASNHILERVRQLEDIGTQFNVPLKAAALQFCLAHPATSVLMLGASSVVELESSLAALAVNIPNAYWQALQKAALLELSAPIPIEQLV